jgi:hypothetical protein
MISFTTGRKKLAYRMHAIFSCDIASEASVYLADIYFVLTYYCGLCV